MSNDAASKRHVLVVEDERSIRELLRVHLTLNGFDVDEIADGHAALERTRAREFALVVLDLMLPGLDGITLCRSIRAQGANRTTPILMLTARDAESDKVLGLESGADDYMTKPFGVREFVARVSALMRRTQAPPSDAASGRTVTTHDLELDPDRRRAVVRGGEVELTKQEFDLLHLLATHPGIVFSREAMLQRVWHGDTFVTERTVDTVVSRLRRKIERDPQDPELLLTAWGVGYKFVDREVDS
jgi:DNA-binding response OmpR family regulator